MTVSEAVLTLRSAVGLTQERFAKRVGVSHKTIARYETDQPPGGNVLIRLAGISLGERHPELAEVFWDAYRDELLSSGVDLRLLRSLLDRETVRSRIVSTAARR